MSDGGHQRKALCIITEFGGAKFTERPMESAGPYGTLAPVMSSNLCASRRIFELWLCPDQGAQLLGGLYRIGLPCISHLSSQAPSMYPSRSSAGQPSVLLRLIKRHPLLQSVLQRRGNFALAIVFPCGGDPSSGSWSCFGLPR